MYKYLPSKKFLLVILSIIIAIIIIGLSLYLKKLQPAPARLTVVEAQNKVQEFMALDSDKDGLLDWEEALWKTDPKKTDTDGDGTNDNDEIKANRDPLKANTAPKGSEPNDKIDAKIIADNKKATDDFNNLSVTDKMGRMLLSQYLASKKMGKSISDAEIANVLDNALSTIPKPIFKQYSMGDLQTFEATTTEEIKGYGDKTVALLSSQKPIEVDFNTVVNSLAEEDSPAQITEKLKKLQPLVDANHQIALGLLKIKTPTKIAILHLSLANAFEAISENLTQIIASANDPVQMLSLINTYPDTAKNLKDVISKFSML